ncbi:MAG: M3 family metallopeptidase [Candidatus Latescibacterota bacterium]|nr:M3 family metallopeptidase [Candidatus Latescibacterota bacterium]
MKKDNPLLGIEGLPLYGEILPEHVRPAIDLTIKIAEESLTTLENNAVSTWHGLMEKLEEIDSLFSKSWAPIEHLLSVKNSEEFRQAHETVQPRVVSMSLKIKQSQSLFEQLCDLRDGPHSQHLNPAQKRAVMLRIRNAERGGVGLKGTEKARFNDIERSLSKLKTTFSNRLLDSTKAFELIIDDEVKTEGWPQSLRAITAQSHCMAHQSSAIPDKGPWRITLDMPTFMPFMQHHRDRKSRELVYKAYVSRASSDKLDNSECIKEILHLRKEQAQLLGFEHFADWSISEKMAPDVATVEQMFDELQNAAEGAMRCEFEEIKKYAEQNGLTEPLMHWDIAFWSERLREHLFDYTDDQLRPYFPLPKVLSGLFDLCEHLFNVEIEETDVKPSNTWNNSVMFFAVKHNKKSIANFYLDPFSRPEEKRGGAWMNSCLDRRIQNGELQTPVVHLICNGTPPVGDQPSLMSFREVITLFHEFGHGLQGMLTTIDHADISGLNGVEWDAVEIASQFMENWCYNKPTLISMTSHIETGQQLPDELFEKIVKARTFQSGMAMMRQLLFGRIDIALHRTFDPDGPETPFDIEKKISEKMSPLKPLEESRFLCSFSHIFSGGYAAGYYSYKWSEVLSSDAFATFEEVGLDNRKKIREVGLRLRDTILSLGGSQDPMEIYQNFRGRQPSTDALLRHSGLTNGK